MPLNRYKWKRIKKKGTNPGNGGNGSIYKFIGSKDIQVMMMMKFMGWYL
jgi:hypothetical protein